MIKYTYIIADQGRLYSHTFYAEGAVEARAFALSDEVEEMTYDIASNMTPAGSAYGSDESSLDARVHQDMLRNGFDLVENFGNGDALYCSSLSPGR